MAPLLSTLTVLLVWSAVGGAGRGEAGPAGQAGRGQSDQAASQAASQAWPQQQGESVRGVRTSLQGWARLVTAGSAELDSRVVMTPSNRSWTSIPRAVAEHPRARCGSPSLSAVRVICSETYKVFEH